MAGFDQFRRHPSLLARQATDQMALERELAGVLVERGHGADGELARLMAATFLAASRTAGVLWLEGGGERPLPEVVDRGQSLLGTYFPLQR